MEVCLQLGIAFDSGRSCKGDSKELFSDMDLRRSSRLWPGVARKAVACAESEGSAQGQSNGSQKADLRHLELHSAHGLTVGNRKVRQQRRVTDNGRQGVTVLMGQPLTVGPLQCSH